MVSSRWRPLSSNVRPQARAFVIRRLSAHTTTSLPANNPLTNPMDSGTQQAIAASIVASVAALISTLISAYFGYRAVQLSKVDKEHEQLLAKQAKELGRCYRQLAAFHELESRACQGITATTGENQSTTQKSLRSEVEQAGLERPAITRTEAEKRLAELES